MGLAYKAPQYTYRRSYYISSHVLERLRTRNPDSDAISDGVIYRDQYDLMNRIDEAIKTAVAAKQVHHVWDKGDAARIVEIKDWFLDNETIYVLLKRDAKNERMWAAITVFTEYQFENNKRKGRWVWADAPHPESLPPKDKPKPASPLPNPVLSVAAAVSIKPVKPLPPKPVEPKVLPGDAMILCYQTKDGNTKYEHSSAVDIEECRQRIISNPDYLDGSLETYGRIKLQPLVVRGPLDF